MLLDRSLFASVPVLIVCALVACSDDEPSGPGSSSGAGGSSGASSSSSGGASSGAAGSSSSSGSAAGRCGYDAGCYRTVQTTLPGGDPGTCAPGSLPPTFLRLPGSDADDVVVGTDAGNGCTVTAVDRPQCSTKTHCENEYGVYDTEVRFDQGRTKTFTSSTTLDVDGGAPCTTVTEGTKVADSECD